MAACAACAGVSVTSVRSHIWPVKPSGEVPFHSAQGPSPAGAVSQPDASKDGCHGSPPAIPCCRHQRSQTVLHPLSAAIGSRRRRSSSCTFSASCPVRCSVGSLIQARTRLPPQAAVTRPTGTFSVFFSSRAKK